MSTKVKISIVIIIASGILAIGCLTEKPSRVSYQLPPSHLSVETWEEALKTPPLIDTFKVLTTGSVKVPLEGMLNIKKLKDAEQRDKYIWVDVFVFLFHHREKGWFMIDTGLDSSFRADGNIGGLLAGNYIKASRQQRGQNIAAQLKRENKRMQGIFLTHLHGDHTAGLPELDHSIPKYIAKGEKYINVPFLYHSNHLTKEDQLIELDWTKGVNKSPLDAVVDIFGDGSFFGIHTPGHSNHHLSYLLITTQGAILLTGDASHTKYGFANRIEPGWTDDEKLAEHSLEQLIKFHELNPQVKVIYGHER